MTMPPLENAPGPAASRVLQLVTPGMSAGDAVTVTEANAEHMLEAMPAPAAILDADRRIVAANSLFLELLGASKREAVVGMRPGEALTCVHAAEAPGGCGSSPHCGHCGQQAAVREAAERVRRVVKEATIQSRQANDGGAMEFRVHATPITLDGRALCVLGLEDVRSERRRQVLERTLFHDLRSTVEEILELSARLHDPLLDAAAIAASARRLQLLGERASDQIDAQHQLCLAEQGSLDPEYSHVELSPFVAELLAFHRPLPCAEGRLLRHTEIPDGVVYVDRRLLRRVLGQLVANALEATPAGETVTVSCERDDEGTRFVVHNPGVIPMHGQLLLFKRAFTTRSGPGRGVGLHYAKMLTDFYLDGELGFRSTADLGTTFELRLR
jgi:hypothetical protein